MEKVIVICIQFQNLKSRQTQIKCDHERSHSQTLTIKDALATELPALPHIKKQNLNIHSIRHAVENDAIIIHGDS